MTVNSHASEFLAIVPARYGSKGFPEKNLKIIGGQSLFERAVSQGLRTCGRTILTTDISEVRGRMKVEGDSCLITRNRPPKLATDSASMEDVVIDVLSNYDIHERYIILLQPTSPLRTDQDIKRAQESIWLGDFSMLMSVVKRDSSVLKSGLLLSDGEFSPLRSSSDCFTNRQLLPDVVKPNGAIYIFDVSEMRIEQSFPVRKIGAYLMPKERSLDIDNEEDFRNACKAVDGTWIGFSK